jgi:hypothetical protein
MLSHGPSKEVAQNQGGLIWLDFDQRRLFTLGSFSKITHKRSPNFWLLFSLQKQCIHFKQKWLGMLIGGIFTNSSGHPAQN